MTELNSPSLLRCGTALSSSGRIWFVLIRRLALKIFITTMKTALGGLRGLPDVIGFFPDGRIRLHEAKNAGAKDRLQAGQHAFANMAR